MKMKTHVIINPISGGGRTVDKIPRILAALERELGSLVTVCITQRARDAMHAAREAVRRGYDRIVAVGGDGTINEVVNGLYEHGRPLRCDCRLGIISTGSGQGLALSLHLPRLIEEQVQVIARDRLQSVDLGRVRLRTDDGAIEERLFVNECQIGLGAAVVQHTGASKKRLGGTLAYGLTALTIGLSCRSIQVSLQTDDALTISRPILGIAVGNGSHTAGGMKLTPNARLDDGALDILLIHAQTKWRRLLNLSRIYTGGHIHLKEFTYMQVKHLELSSNETIPVAVDGEWVGSTPCTIDVLPHALSIIGKQRNGEGIL